MNRRTLLSAALSCLAAPWVKWGAGEPTVELSPLSIYCDRPKPRTLPVNEWFRVDDWIGVSAPKVDKLCTAEISAGGSRWGLIATEMRPFTLSDGKDITARLDWATIANEADGTEWLLSADLFSEVTTVSVSPMPKSPPHVIDELNRCIGRTMAKAKVQAPESA
jgi:hypothetical protein